MTLWVGGLWISGYLVAPVLFATLDDRQLAGQLAGQVFHLVNIIGLVVGTVLLLSIALQQGRDSLRDGRARIVLLMLILVIVTVSVLQPMMQELKLTGLVPGSEAAAQFGRMHGVSAIMHLGNSLLGLWLVATGFAAGGARQSAA